MVYMILKETQGGIVVRSTNRTKEQGVLAFLETSIMFVRIIDF